MRILTTLLAGLLTIGLAAPFSPAEAEIKVRGKSNASSLRAVPNRGFSAPLKSVQSNKGYGTHKYGSYTPPAKYGNNYGGSFGGGVQVGYSKPGFSIGLNFGNSSYGGGYCAPARTWIPGCWVTERERYWVPGCTTRVWNEPIYETRYDECGRPIQVLVAAGYYSNVNQPGYWDYRDARRWVPGHWN